MPLPDFAVPLPLPFGAGAAGAEVFFAFDALLSFGGFTTSPLLLLVSSGAEESGGASSLEEVRFVLMGEPAYRVFEMVNDAAKVEAQMRRMGRGTRDT